MPGDWCAEGEGRRFHVALGWGRKLCIIGVWSARAASRSVPRTDGAWCASASRPQAVAQPARGTHERHERARGCCRPQLQQAGMDQTMYDSFMGSLNQAGTGPGSSCCTRLL